jgi:import inner membrane translocase subunit TIM8
MQGPEVSAELQQFIQRETQVAQIQQMVASLTDVCWDKCVGAPGSYLSSKETSCLENCAKRFVETTQYILQRAASRQGGDGSF